MFFQVRATHKYVAEDDDELTFEKGEIIYVIPFEDPEDQVVKTLTTDTTIVILLFICL